jgi:hypothetical protein
LASGWQEQYENDLYAILTEHGVELTEEVRNLVLGGEVAMWSEQVTFTIIPWTMNM